METSEVVGQPSSQFGPPAYPLSRPLPVIRLTSVETSNEVCCGHEAVGKLEVDYLGIAKKK